MQISELMANNPETEERNALKAYNMMLYFAGTMIMWDPSTECIRDFWKREILKRLPVTSSNPGFIKAASLLRDSVDDPDSSHEMMKSDFGRLFSGNASRTAPPVESEIRTPGLRSRISVTEFYDSYGWKSKFSSRFPDDHLGVELFFLTLMIEKYLELDDEACNIEMKKEIRRFIDKHLFSWVPEWNRLVQEKAVTKSYKGIASLIQACTEDIYSIMTESTEQSKVASGLN